MRAGSLLEKNIEKIFSLAGFNTERNKIINNYEIDVWAELKNFKVAVQCKQYEKSNLNVKDLIHQWNSKKDLIGADKILICVYGVRLLESDIDLAEELGVRIWNEKYIDYFMDMVIKNREYAQDKLVDDLNVIPKEREGFFSKLFNLNKAKQYGEKMKENKSGIFDKLIWAFSNAFNTNKRMDYYEDKKRGIRVVRAWKGNIGIQHSLKDGKEEVDLITDERK